MSSPSLHLKPNREKSILKHHPWIYSGAVEKVTGNPNSGETVAVYASDGKFLAWGAYSPKSQIICRIWTWDESDVIDSEFLRRKLQIAIDFRKAYISNGVTNSYRCVFSESDGIPGLIIDRYDSCLVLQITSAGAEFWRNSLIGICREVPGVTVCYERSESEIRKLEGLSPSQGLIFGTKLNSPLEIHEWGIRYLVDIENGQKTGFFLDQRENRKMVQEFSNNARVLNCFSYTGGFSLNAFKGGATEIISIDSSAEAIGLAVKNWELNSFPNDRGIWIEGDVFQELRKFRDRNEKFDLIILDPPKFAPNTRSVPAAARAYKDINLLAFKLLREGGVLFTFSCSGGIDSDLFQKIVQGAALDAKREVLILEKLRQDLDHPVSLNFPEAEYLKGLICRVVI
jgi:23S rRNA (cytosine1962-C5)-methyltransferase